MYLLPRQAHTRARISRFSVDLTARVRRSRAIMMDAGSCHQTQPSPSLWSMVTHRNIDVDGVRSAVNNTGSVERGRDRALAAPAIRTKDATKHRCILTRKIAHGATDVTRSQTQPNPLTRHRRQDPVSRVSRAWRSENGQPHTQQDQ
jgi:hypothetical protein